MTITKNVIINWYFSMKKEEKDLEDFQNSIISFGYVDFYAKIFLILYART